MKIAEREGFLMAVLSAVYLLVRLPVSLILPLIRDEAIYAIMIEEQKAHLTLVPTFLGHFVSWKPPLFFWAYIPSTLLPIPFELSYRLPSLLFGLLTIPLLFRLLRNAGVSRNLAFLSILFSLFTVHAIYPNSTLLTDSMAFFLIILSLALYTESRLPAYRFIAAGAVAILAFFVKLVIAFMIPVLAAVFVFSSERRHLRSPLFLASLLAVPLAFLAHYAILDNYGLAVELYQSDVGGKVFSSSGAAGQLEVVQTTVWALFVTGGMLWLSLGIYGFIKYWKETPFLSAWFAFSAIPLVSSAFLLWYFLPVIPAISYFAIKLLAIWKGKERYDAIFFLVFAVFSLSLLAFSAYIVWILYDSFHAEREAGIFLSGKENIAVIGNYTPSIISYMAIPRMREGHAPDYGWIVFPETAPPENITPFLTDYRYGGVPVTDGSFSSFFTKTDIFRKDTNLTKIDYIVVAKAPGATLDMEAVFNESNITIYKAG